MIDSENRFTKMQRDFYAHEAAKWSPDNRDPVVGAWDAHNAHEDYELLFDGIDTSKMVALDFGCGPGRNIVRYAKRFKRIDGADIDRLNLTNARIFCAFKTFPLLYHVDGTSLKCIGEDGKPFTDAEFKMGCWFDLVFSTICLQHIPVHSIRLNLFREFFRVLKPGGWFTAQMGFGDNGDPRGVGYYEDKWDATATNGSVDVKVTNTLSLRADLQNVGFDEETFRAIVRPTGPNDWHPKWVFFRAKK